MSADDVPVLVGLEWVVDDPDLAVEFFESLGFGVLDRLAHPSFDADMIVVDAGAVAITLVTPTAVGDRPPLERLESDLAQLVFTVGGSDGEGHAEFLARQESAGIPMIHGQGMSFTELQGIKSILGVTPAFVFQPPVD